VSSFASKEVEVPGSRIPEIFDYTQEVHLTLDVHWLAYISLSLSLAKNNEP
jgi:hypothetical protein